MPSLFPTSGNILGETQASTQQAFNTAYRRFQDALCDAGAERFQGETVIKNIPVMTNLDPAAQQSISWFNFFDGTDYQSSPVLPRNLILPLWMSERPAMSGGVSSSSGVDPTWDQPGINWDTSGLTWDQAPSSQSTTTFTPTPSPWLFPDVNNPNMRCMTDGLQSAQKYQYNGQWEWRGDAIYFPGSTMAVDFRIRYRAYLLDIVDSPTARWFQRPVPIMRCLDPLAWWLCAEYAAARSADGDASEQMLAVAAACKEEAMEATKLVANRDVMKNQRDDVRRVPYGGGSRGRGSMGYGR